MKLIIALNHPAHFHLFKYFALEMRRRGHLIKFFIKSKDVLEELLVENELSYTKYNTIKIAKNSKLKVVFSNFMDLTIQDTKLFTSCLKERPDALLGTDVAISHVGKLLGIESFVFNEDDYHINKTFCDFSYPYATHIVSPFVCDVGNYEHKRIGYNGYQKLAYLHPNWFQPNKDLLSEYLDKAQKYFILRLVSFTAVHDIVESHHGISEQQVDEFISLISPHGRILIFSEKKLPPKYTQFMPNLPKHLIHHLMAFAEFIVSESQTMTAEACLLGTPSIRYNTFVGRIKYLDELENHYGLGYGVLPDNKSELFNIIESFLATKNLKEIFSERRNKLLNEKIDVTNFFIGLFENVKKKK